MVEKKVRAEPAAVRRSWIEPAHPELSLVAQSQLLGLVRSSLYYRAREDTPFERALMRRLDEEYTAHPFDGSRRMTAVRRRAGYPVHRKRVLRLRVRLGLQAIAPKPATSRTGAAPRLYPYWLRGVTVTAPDPVWSTDITYLRLDRGLGT